METLSQLLMLLRDGANLEILIFVGVAVCLILGATGRGIVAVYKFFRPTKPLLCFHCQRPLLKYETSGLCDVCIPSYRHTKRKAEVN